MRAYTLTICLTLLPNLVIVGDDIATGYTGADYYLML